QDHPAYGPPEKKVQLEGTVIAITGANRGISLGIADSSLANSAARIYSLDISDPGEDFVAISSRYPNCLFALHADVTSEPSMQATVDKIVDEAGAIHAMVCNAGCTKHKPTLDFTPEEIGCESFHVFLYGSFYSARIAARGFIKPGVKGSIVFTASMASCRPNKRVPSAPYGAFTAGIRNMVHTLAMEWTQHNIRVNSVSPDLIKTAMTYCVPQ
ncbi:NAD(P)-binding protein, partial [Byssothecium circinans]